MIQSVTAPRDTNLSDATEQSNLNSFVVCITHKIRVGHQTAALENSVKLHDE